MLLRRRSLVSDYERSQQECLRRTGIFGDPNELERAIDLAAERYNQIHVELRTRINNSAKQIVAEVANRENVGIGVRLEGLDFKIDGSAGIKIPAGSELVNLLRFRRYVTKRFKEILGDDRS